MNPNLLKELIIEQKEQPLPKDFFKRNILEKIEPLIKTNDILVLTGLRRCGKSTAMQKMRKSSKNGDYFINFDDDRLAAFQVSDFQILLEVFIELFGLQHEFYFDEIQNIPEWERFVRRLHNQGNKIYITGSNATLFSQELGTRLTGRYIQLEMFPYSFLEYMQHFHPEILQTKIYTTQLKGLIQRLFAKYLELGGIPEYVRFGEKSYLQNLYESILYRDIIAHYHLTSDIPIKKFVLFLASHIGKEFSYSYAAKLIGLSSATTVSDYCSFLQNSYLCFFVNRYSHSLNKQLLYNKKTYFIDHALARIVGFRPSEDRGRLFENIVFLELKRRGAEIYFHKEKKECDFITRKEGRINQAIQVCTYFSSPETKNREIDGLREAMQAYSLNEGLILTEHDEESVDVPEGTIYIKQFWKWLLE